MGIKLSFLPKTKRFIFFISLIFMEMALGQVSQKTVIFWDTSTSRLDRNSKMEMEYLSAYFERFTDLDVTLIGFSNTVHFKENYTISGGDWSKLKESIERFQYDGATSYVGLEVYSENGYNLVFTDGFQNAGTITPKLKPKAVVINSSKNFDKRTMNLFAILGKAEFLDLPKKKEEESKKTKPAKTIAKNSTDTTDLGIREGLVLDEVVVSENANSVDKLESTALGKKDNDAVGYAVQSIGSDKIKDAVTTLNTGIQGKFSNVTLGQNDDLSQVTMRTSNSLLGNNYGLIVVDGVPLAQSQSNNGGTLFSSSFIDPKNVDDITVLKGLAATNIYGTQGANGVLLITTKTGSYGSSKNGASDAMQLKDNYYDTKIKIDNKTLVTPYLKELKKGNDVQSAYKIYLGQKDACQDSPNYLIDVFDFFYKSSPTVAFRILSNVLEMESASYPLLRAAFLKSVHTENMGLALSISNRLKDEFPQKAQNTYDFAVVNREIGNFQVALNNLNGLLENDIKQNPGLVGLEKPTGTELRNLINQNRSKLDLSKVGAKYQNNITYNAKIVLEWSNPEAEFVVQFVNPQKRFFDWEHSRLFDSKRFYEEIEGGFHMEQFEIVGSETIGDWILNITSKENTSPTFIKCTVVKNFGKNNQDSSSFMVRLQDADDKKQLAKFTIQ